MILEGDFATISENATRDELIRHIESLGEGRYSIAILLRGPDSEFYMQTALLDDGETFSLEFREGEARRHYSFETSSKDLILSAFLRYLEGGDDWRTRVEWERDRTYESTGEPIVDEREAPFLAADRPSMAVFTASDDLSSRVFAAQLTSLRDRFGDRVRIDVVDIDAEPGTASRWGVSRRCLPVQLVFAEGVLHTVLRGVRSAKALGRELAAVLDGSPD